MPRLLAMGGKEIQLDNNLREAQQFQIQPSFTYFTYVGSSLQRFTSGFLLAFCFCCFPLLLFSVCLLVSLPPPSILPPYIPSSYLVFLLFLSYIFMISIPVSSPLLFLSSFSYSLSPLLLIFCIIFHLKTRWLLSFPASNPVLFHWPSPPKPFFDTLKNLDI